MSSETEQRSVPIDNIVGILKGRDETLAAEYVVIGAHYDHVGVDTRGRVGCGADDNASGVAAMLEIVSALAQAGPRRSILACAFAAEEDGLIGSKALCDKLPVPRDKLVAMINLDMVGRGEAGEVAVLGLIENPKLEDVLERAKKLAPTKIKNIVMRQGQDLFARSDHYSFHQIGVPVLFFFEGLPIDKNKDYHTWRDTIDLVDVDKIGRTARLVFNTAWLLADDDERPPKPEKAGH
jgi:Zn-dependent M28 family amino/carboxypeptidase